MFSSLLAVAACLATIVAAQSSTMSDASPTSMLASSAVTSVGPSATSYPIDPAAISTTIKEQWCGAQYNSCYQLCNDAPSANNCNATTLAYTCTCSNGPTPNLARFNQTIPYFECTTYVANCIAMTDNAEAQRTCLQTVCGGPVLPINYVSSSSSSSMMSSTAAMTTSSSATGSAPAASTTAAAQGNAAIALQAAEQYGAGVFGLIAAAAFGLVL